MSRDSRAALAAVVAVIVVLILGFRFLGSPSTQRLIQADVRTVQSMNRLAQQIRENFQTSSGQLPANLDSVADSLKLSPVTRKAFVYKPKSKIQYDLCGTFLAKSPEPPERPNPSPSGEERWAHPAGDFCFSLDASQPVPNAPYFY